MSNESQLNSKCKICFSSTKELKIIFKTLIKKLSLLLISKEIQSADILCQAPNDSFSHLIRTLNLEGNSQTNNYYLCKHQKWYRLFRRSLKCSPEAFNFICDFTVSKIAERTYHLWLLEAQIKNVCQKLTEPHFKTSSYSIERKQSIDSPSINRGLLREKEGGSLSSVVGVQSGQGMNMMFYPTTQTSISEYGEGVNGYGYYYTFPFSFNPTP